MDIIVKFLNILSDLIHNGDSNTNNRAEIKNKILQVKNILLENNITGEVDYDDLLKISNENMSTIFECIYEEYANKLATFISNKTIVNGFRNLSFSDAETFAPKQYSLSVDSLSETATDINVFINQDVSELVDVTLYKKYSSKFAYNKQKEVIDDLEEFNALVDGLELTSNEKGLLKKEIGIGNIVLVNPPEEQEFVDINKYIVIYEGKKIKYRDLILLLKKESLDNIDELSTKYNYSKEDINTAIGLINLDKKIKEYKDVYSRTDMSLSIKNSYLDSIINELEDITNSMKQVIPEVPSEVTEVKEEVKEEEPKVSNDDILSEVSHILESEKEFMRTIDFNNLNAYLVKGIDGSADGLKYKVASILTGLYGEVEKLKNFTNVPSVYNACIGNIKEYLEAYHIVKNQMVQTNGSMEIGR